ncbi:hypothetical protein [Streptomyces sp. NPDC091259]|uniref:hypothetical protein n=1 Tax=Streptomyces sp. NPDC091259 TaxID=3365976 RepID=UPI003829531A
MGTKWFAAPWGVALALVAVTAVAAPTAALGRAPDRARSAQRTVLTNADAGRTVTASPGADVEVRLTHHRVDGLTYSWGIPTSGDPAVLRRTSGRTTPGGDAAAVFHAEGGGVATVTVLPRCRADQGQVCPLVIVPWKARIEVR